MAYNPRERSFSGLHNDLGAVLTNLSWYLNTSPRYSGFIQKEQQIREEIKRRRCIGDPQLNETEEEDRLSV